MASPRILERPGWFAVWLLLIVAGVVFVAWPKAGGPPDLPRTPDGGIVLLETTLRPTDAPAASAFRLARPGMVRVEVTPPADATARMTMGPPAPAKVGDTRYRVNAAKSWEFEAKAGSPPFQKPIFAVGNYILEVAPIPTAMGEEAPAVHVRVSVMPEKPPAQDT
jgi:hypothetical protein